MRAIFEHASSLLSLEPGYIQRRLLPEAIAEHVGTKPIESEIMAEPVELKVCCSLPIICLPSELNPRELYTPWCTPCLSLHYDTYQVGQRFESVIGTSLPVWTIIGKQCW